MDVLESQLAGTWYPGEPERLREMVDAFLAAGEGPQPGLRALVVPHAGYAYSGRVAGAGYARVPRGQFRRAVVVAPSHYHAFPGAAIFPGKGFETPLGVVAVDRQAANRLASFPGFVSNAGPYRREHSLEIQLPFLQRLDPDLRLVPVLVGATDLELRQVALGLQSLDDGETLYVVSSDFTHYGEAFDYLPFPPTGAEEVSRRLRELDFGAIEPILRLDAEGFESYLRRTGITVCGQGPIAAFLRVGWVGLEGTVAAYGTSLDVTGDYEHSVSYAAIVFAAADEGR
jgi:hypothetical protein